MAATAIVEKDETTHKLGIREVDSANDFSGGAELVAIKFSGKDRAILQSFLAVAASGKKDPKALALTEAVICINSASYHAWSYRWQCLEAISSREELTAEKKFLERIAAVNVKNYQLWNHRRRLALRLGPECAHEELEFAEHCLADDSKNYHAWAHRQALVERFGLQEEELLFTAQMILDDLRNNSAWNQRFLLISGAKRKLPPEVVRRELEFAAQAILKAPHNESPWNYTRGIAALADDPAFMACDPQLHSICQEVLEDWPSCTPALSLLAEIYMAQSAESSRRGDKLAAATIAGLACQCFGSLQTTDPVRSHYWLHKQAASRAAESSKA